MTQIRTDWTREEIAGLFDLPFTELLFQAATVHREFHPPEQVQLCTLLSIKTGGCPEDCGYCPQAARYHTSIDKNDLLPYETVVGLARRAKENIPRTQKHQHWSTVKAIETLEKMISFDLESTLILYVVGHESV